MAGIAGKFDIVKFLKLYQEFPCLWDKSDAEYKLRDKRDLAEQSILNRRDQEYPLIERVCVICSFIVFLVTLPFSLFFVFKIVAQFQRAIIFRMGRVRKGRARGPGLFFVLPCVDITTNIDLRTSTAQIPPQEILTKDSCTIFVDAVIFYRVVDPMRSVITINNYKAATKQLASTTLRNVLSQRNLSEILTDRVRIGEEIEQYLDKATISWGVKVEHVEIKDISLPKSMQRAMASEATATRDAKAKIIDAEGEFKASLALKQASDVLAKSSGAIQLRYLQTLATIAAEQESTVLFPIPVELGS